MMTPKQKEECVRRRAAAKDWGWRGRVGGAEGCLGKGFRTSLLAAAAVRVQDRQTGQTDRQTGQTG